MIHNNILNIYLYKDIKEIFKFSLIPCILSVFKFIEFFKYYSNDSTIYDYTLYILNDYFFMLYLVATIFLFCLNKISNSTEFSNYVYIRFKNRKVFFIKNIIFFFMSAFIFIFNLSISSILISFIFLLDINEWGNFSFYYFQHIKVLFDVYSPLFSIILLNIKLALYLTTLASIYYLLINISDDIRVSTISFIVIFGLNIVINQSQIDNFLRFTLFYNARWNWDNIHISSFCLNSLYFVVLIICLNILSFKVFKHKDLYWS